MVSLLIGLIILILIFTMRIHFIRHIQQFSGGLFTLCLVILSPCLLAQSQENKDRLYEELRLANTDIKKIDALNNLAYEFYDFDDSIGFYYARQALTLANKIDYPTGLQYAHTMVGVGYFSFGDYTNAIKNFELSHAIPGANKNLDHFLYNTMLTANVMADVGRYDSAKAILENGLALANAKKHKRASSLYKSLARLQARLWQNKEALYNIKMADSLRKDVTEYDRSDIYYTYAMIYLNQSDLVNAEIYIQKLCASVEGVDDYFHKSMCLLLKSEVNRLKGHYAMALSNAFDALEITEVYSYPYLRGQIFLKIGSIYSEMSEYSVSLEFLFRALKITEKSGIDPLTAEAYAELGWIFKEQKNFEMALEYVDRSQKIREMIGDKKSIASSHNYRGLIYFLKGKYTESIAEHEKAMAIRESINYSEGVAASMFNIALVYEEKGDLNRALDLQLKGLKIDEEIGNPMNVNLSYIGIASLLVKMDRLAEAEDFLLKSKKLAEQTGSKIMLRANYGIFKEFFEAKGDYKRAYEFAEKFRAMNDSIFSESSTMKIAEMQSLYDVERKEQQIELLSKESALQANQLSLQNARLNNQRILIFAGTAFLILIIVILFYIIRTNRRLKKAQFDLAEMNEELLTQSEELRESNDSLVEVYNRTMKQQDEIQQQSEELKTINNDLEEKRNEIEAQAEELREANETISTINQHLEEKVEERTEQLKQAYIELDTFFYRSSHDFRRPITTFIGLAEVAKITSKEESTLELFSKVKETALSLDRMIRKLQTISDVGAQKMVFKEILVKELIANILDTHKDELRTKQIKIIDEIDSKETFKSYGALVNVILENLIENAIQFATPLDPYIKIQATSDQKSIILQIEDNGQGIPEEYHEKIFDMYFRASISSKGNGLGLYIVKKAVDKLEGTIRFETTLNEGTTFFVELPIAQS